MMSTIKLSNQHIADLNRRRRTVVNYDSQCHAPPFICEGVEPQQLVEFSFSLIDTDEHGIDAVWWCFGPGDEAAYPSKVLPTYRAAKYKKWIEAGVDIVRLYIEQTQKRGLEAFISWRMNGGPASALWTNKFIVDYPIAGDLDRDEMEPQKKAHPDWLMKVWQGTYFWNYAVPGVHEYRLRCLREVAENYDLDGFELDFCRGIPFLPVGHQWENRDRLTDFVRSVRFMLLDLEEKRGRPLLLAARVPDHVEGAKIDDFDLETWAREHLVDIFVPGARSLDNDVASFRQQIMKKT